MKNKKCFKSVISTALAVLLAAPVALPAAAEQQTAAVTFNDDLGDFTFFNSDYAMHAYGAKYPNITYQSNDNLIECEAFDYKNAAKGNAIIMEKKNDKNCYIDITPTIFKGYKSTKKYRNYKMSGEFECDFSNITSETQDNLCLLFCLKDVIKVDGKYESLMKNPIIVKKNGSLYAGGRSFAGVAENNKKFRITMYVNLDSGEYTAFLEREAAEGGFSQREKIIDNQLLFSRTDSNTKDDNFDIKYLRFLCGASSYSGTMTMRHVEFTGLDKPFNAQTDTETKTSMFETVDNAVGEYLSDKTAMCFYGAKILANGVKSDMQTEPVLSGGELYVSLADFNAAFSSNVTVSGSAASLGSASADIDISVVDGNGNVMVPAQKLARELLGKATLLTEDGLLIVSESETGLSEESEVPYHLRQSSQGYINRLSSLQYINDYVEFSRPKAAQLKAGLETSKGGVHPRVLATSEDFARIKAQRQSDQYIGNVVTNLLSKADAAAAKAAITYKYDDDLRTTNTANELEKRMLLLGFAYQITNDDKYAEAVWKNLSALNSFPDLNYGHPIDSGSYGVGIAIGYDWCYDYFTAEQRANICENADRLHISVLNNGFYGRVPAKTSIDVTINMIGIYNKWISNYNTWANGGSVLMALAFMDEYPDECSSLLENSIRSLEYTVKNLYPGGAWAESSTYWMQVAKYFSYTLGSLKKIYNTDFNLSSFKGTKETGIVNMELRSPIGGYNYHDANESSEYAPLSMAFLGEYFSQRPLLAARRKTVEDAMKNSVTATNAPQVFDALFYNPDVSVNEISQLENARCTEGLESFTVHEDYLDNNGLFFASHGGPVSFYHSHNDNGDFVFDLNGVRWARALGSEDYNSPLGYNERYRNRTEGHNTISINNGAGYNQLANTYSPIIENGETPNGTYAIYDMSDSYADADSVKRGFYINGNYDSLTVRDEITLNKDNSEIYWFMHTKENISINPSGDGACLTSSDGKKLYVSFETNAENSEIFAMDAVPLDSSPQGEGQNSNTGYRKIAIRLVASGNVHLTVRLGENVESIMNYPLSQWNSIAPADRLLYENMNSINGLSGAEIKAVPIFAKCNIPTEDVATISGETYEGRSVLKISKNQSKKNAWNIFLADISRYVDGVDRYMTSFRLKPEIMSGSFNIYAGAVAQIEYKNGVYSLYKYDNVPSGDSVSFDKVKLCDLETGADGYITLGIEKNGETASIYLNGELLGSNIAKHKDRSFSAPAIVLNNGLLGNVYIDEFEVRATDSYLRGNVLGDVLSVEGYAAGENPEPSVLAGFYNTEEQLIETDISENAFWHGAVRTEFAVPQNYKKVSLFMWDKGQIPLCKNYIIKNK